MNNTKECLEQIKSDLKHNRFEISHHAYERMSEREISIKDIFILIKNGLNHLDWNEKHETWNFTGNGFEGVAFTIACSYNNENTLIVTVFWE